MNKYKLAFLLLIIVTGFFCFFSENAMEITRNNIIIVIEDRLTQPLEQEIALFKNDLKNEGYIVTIDSSISNTTSPVNIRRMLQNNFKSNKNLTGAIFVGNIAAPLFNTLENQGDPYWHDYLSDFYYMDLDGIWDDSDGNGVNDKHKDTYFDFWNKISRKINLNDSRTPEIWVSRIRADKLTSLGNEITLIKKYFRKNHEYRTGKMQLPLRRAFVVSAGVKLNKSDWGAFPEKIYSEIDREEFHDKLGYSLRKFLSSKEGYEWGVINVFSGPRIHHFNHFNNEINSEWWKSKEGRQFIADYSEKINDPNDVSWKDIIEIKPNVLFYHLLTSEVGRHDYPDYLGGLYIFSGSGLAAIAGTQHSGSVGSPLLYDYLAQGNSIGDSWKRALNYLTQNSSEKIFIYYYPNIKEVLKAGKNNYKAVLLGDGTLRLPEM